MQIEQIRQAVYKIPVRFNTTGVAFVYLLRGDQVALVDSGVADTPLSVLRGALAEIGLALSDVSVVLSTHAHLDHIGGNMQLRQASSAKIHVHAADLPMAQSVEAEVEFHTAPLRTLEFPSEAVADRAAHVRDNAGEAAGADVVLSDGDVIDLGAGLRLRVIHCPGHTPGQVAYWWEKEGLLLTGDAIQGWGSRPGGYPLYHDAPSYRRSQEALLRLGPQTLCLGHAYLGGTLINHPVRQGSEAAAFVRASLGTADTIHHAVLAAIEQHPHGSARTVALAALDELLHDIPQVRLRRTGMPALAGPTLLAHIESARAGLYQI